MKVKAAGFGVYAWPADVRTELVAIGNKKEIVRSNRMEAYTLHTHGRTEVNIDQRKC